MPIWGSLKVFGPRYKTSPSTPVVAALGIGVYSCNFVTITKHTVSLILIKNYNFNFDSLTSLLIN